MLELKYTFFDKLCLQFDQALKTIVPTPHLLVRTNPAVAKHEAPLTEQEKKQVAALMRVNHVGEICAQALYKGQALTATSPEVRTQLQHAAVEEMDHLVWCIERLDQINGRTSYLLVFWYTGAFILGALTGSLGDRWSLGFVAETEHQVSEHLQRHLAKLPACDDKTRAILMTMQVEEAQHADLATATGGQTLPKPMQLLMQLAARFMTTTAYYL